MNYIKTKWRELSTILLGLCIVIGRVLLPTKYGVNQTIVVLELSIEIIICVGVIFLNKEKIAKIKENAKNDKLGKFLLKSFTTAIIMILSGMIIGNVVPLVFKGDNILLGIIRKFSTILPFLGYISQVIITPITEELVFRMTIRDLIPNKFLFVIISATLFAFIHDWFYFSAGLPYYFLMGIMFALLYLYKNKDIRYMIAGHSMTNILAAIFQALSKMHM